MNRVKGKYAWSVTVGSKGQIVIPNEARAIFDIQPGDTLLLLGDINRGIAIPPKKHLTSLFSHIFGTVQNPETEEDD